MLASTSPLLVGDRLLGVWLFLLLFHFFWTHNEQEIFSCLITSNTTHFPPIPAPISLDLLAPMVSVRFMQDDCLMQGRLHPHRNSHCWYWRTNHELHSCIRLRLCVYPSVLPIRKWWLSVSYFLIILSLANFLRRGFWAWFEINGQVQLTIFAGVFSYAPSYNVAVIRKANLVTVWVNDHNASISVCWYQSEQFLPASRPTLLWEHQVSGQWLLIGLMRFMAATESFTNLVFSIQPSVLTRSMQCGRMYPILR